MFCSRRRCRHHPFSPLNPLPSPSLNHPPTHRPDNWGQADENGKAWQRAWIRQHVEDSARVLGKPVILEEWGKWVNESADATLADRSAFMGIVYEEVEAAMADPASPLQGSAFWQARPPFF